MPTGLSTIRRGIGIGPLSTISRGYIGGLLILVTCPPALAIVSVLPSLSGVFTTPGSSIEHALPGVTLLGSNPSAGIAKTTPKLDTGGC